MIGNEMKNITLKRPVKLKSGVSFDVGAKMVVEFVTDKGPSGHERSYMQITHPVSGESYKTANWSGYFTPPSVATMQRWSDSGIAKSVTGGKCEMDGYSDDGAPSWMLALGMI